MTARECWPRSGEPLGAYLGRLVAIILSLQFIAGRNVRLTPGPDGTRIDFEAEGMSFSGPFSPSLVSGGVQLDKGLIAGFEPKIGKVRISGDDENPAPVLGLDPKNRSVLGESFVGVEVEPDADGKISEKARIEIVERNGTDGANGTDGRAFFPLAIVIWNDAGPSRVWPVVHHNLGFRAGKPIAEGGSGKAVFYAV